MKKNYHVRIITYETTVLESADLMTLSDAARELGITVPGVISAINRNELTEIVNPAAKFRGRRLLKRSEVDRLARRES